MDAFCEDYANLECIPNLADWRFLGITQKDQAMKHAFLIIAHNEFDVLKLLISCLDDARNDIYIHYDKKVDTLPDIQTKYAGLIVLEKRVDVRWGAPSMIEAELPYLKLPAPGEPISIIICSPGWTCPLRARIISMISSTVTTGMSS